MAKNIKASRLAGSTSHKRRSSKPSFKGNSQSRSNAKGLKVRDRKDVEDMNELKNISELQSHLGTSTTTKKKQTPVKPVVQDTQPTQSATELADNLANML